MMFIRTKHETFIINSTTYSKYSLKSLLLKKIKSKYQQKDMKDTKTKVLFHINFILCHFKITLLKLNKKY